MCKVSLCFFSPLPLPVSPLSLLSLTSNRTMQEGRWYVWNSKRMIPWGSGKEKRWEQVQGELEKGRLDMYPSRDYFRGHSCTTHCVGDCQNMYEYLIFYHLENYSHRIYYLRFYNTIKEIMHIVLQKGNKFPWVKLFGSMVLNP